MEDLREALLFGAPHSAAQRDAFREHLADHPDLASAWAQWRRVRAALRDRLEERVPDRRLLVLYALEQEGRTAGFTPEEQHALDATRADIERVLDARPALQDVVERIQEERADFDAVWSEQAGATDQQEATARRARDRGPKAPAAARSGAWTRRLVGAALAVALAGIVVLMWPQGPSRTTVEVAEGAQRTVTLGNGSTARVVGAATLSYPTRSGEQAVRRVRLSEGRAYFDVQAPGSGSFTVETPTATTTTLGTQFAVQAHAESTEVVLASGEVQVRPAASAQDEGVRLKPGERSWVAQGQAPAPPEPVDLTAALDWTGLFVFRGTPVRTIADRLASHYDAEVRVAPALADEPVTGTFDREQPVDEVLDALAATLGAEVRTIDAETYQIVGQ